MFLIVLFVSLVHFIDQHPTIFRRICVTEVVEIGVPQLVPERKRNHAVTKVTHADGSHTSVSRKTTNNAVRSASGTQIYWIKTIRPTRRPPIWQRAIC